MNHTSVSNARSAPILGSARADLRGGPGCAAPHSHVRYYFVVSQKDAKTSRLRQSGSCPRPTLATDRTIVESSQANERLFDPDDVFFSTTDRKGVIRNANRTFVTLARYPREKLIGAPHNIIRHDEVPAGVFKLMWDDLEAGRPVCAYILNRAADGLDYWVFATVSAVEDGYVSVRTKPLDGETFGVVREVYGRVRAVERQAAEEGAARREVAEG